MLSGPAPAARTGLSSRGPLVADIPSAGGFAAVGAVVSVSVLAGAASVAVAGAEVVSVVGGSVAAGSGALAAAVGSAGAGATERHLLALTFIDRCWHLLARMQTYSPQIQLPP